MTEPPRTAPAARPVCPRCRHRVTLVLETTGQWLAWRACAVLRGAAHRPVGLRTRAAKALSGRRLRPFAPLLRRPSSSELTLAPRLVAGDRFALSHALELTTGCSG
jgi:hypothetical protein